MRVATEEEDRLLQKISFYETDIYNLENEVMLCESEAKGIREQRRKYTVKFFTVIFVCAFLLILSSGYLINIKGDWRLTLAIYLGSGGLGLFALGFLIYTIIFLVRFFAATSKATFWADLAERIGVENLDSLETINLTKHSNFKQNINENRKSLDECTKAYFELKEKNDKQFDEDVASGKIKPGFNFDAYNSYIEVTNEWIDFNKLKVEHLKLTNRKKVIEKDVEDMIYNEDKCKSSIVWFLILLLLNVGTIIAFMISSHFIEPELAPVLRIVTVVFLMLTGIVVIINLINFITKLPYISDSNFALFVADKLGIDDTKKDLKEMLAEIDTTAEKIKEVSEEIQRYKDMFAKNREENFS